MRKEKSIHIIKCIAIILGLLLVCMSFYKISELNYIKTRQIQESIINHPENLPQTQLAKITSIGFKNLKADWYWLRAVQYIGSNALESEYKKYLFEVLDLITDLNPYFEKPYIIGQLLLPSYNYRYETLSNAEKEKYINQGEALGLKWVANFCNTEKIEVIKSEDNLVQVWKDDIYKNPCKSYAPAYYLAYIYHFYKNDSLSASTYYKIAAANDDAPEWAKVLAAIMQGKWGNREKSALMFLWLAKDVEVESDPVCTSFAIELEGFYKNLLSQNRPINGQVIKTLEDTRNQVFWEFNEEKEEEFFWDTKCKNFVNKTIREINLSYIEAGNDKFKKDNNWNNARNAQALFQSWYIDFLPTDNQQYGEYGIIYEYDTEKESFDYTIGTY